MINLFNALRIARRATFVSHAEIARCARRCAADDLSVEKLNL